MGKYFSSDSDLTKFNIEEVEHKAAIPTADNLTSPLPQATKDKLAQQRIEPPATQDDHIDMVKVQADFASEMVGKYSRETKKIVEQQFEKFAPAELFEKLNQILFTIVDLSNRVTSLEKTILANSNGMPTQEKKPITITDPEQLYRLQGRIDELTKIEQPASIPQQAASDNNERPHVDELRSMLADAKNGKARKIPSEGFVGDGVKLEEMFPNLEDAAYTAAYTAMNTYNKTEHTDSKKPEPGSLRNLNGF